MKRILVVAVSAATFVLAGATGAFAGEVKGPPGDPSNPVPSTNFTAAPDHANSACAFSGLNDMNQGPKEVITQTPKDFNDLVGPGSPGHGAPEIGFDDGCRGGSN